MRQMEMTKRMRAWAVVLTMIISAVSFSACDDDDWDGPDDDYGMVGTWQSPTSYGTYVYEFYGDGSGCAYYVGGEFAYFSDYTTAGGILSIDWDTEGWIDQGYITFTGPNSFSLQSMNGGSYGYFTRVF